MKHFFNLENPIWQFIGNLADMFFLSVLWYLCCIPVFTLGCGTSAMYYVTLKLTSHQEGYTISSFFRFFRENFKKTTSVWLILLAALLVLAADFYWSLMSGGVFARAMFITFSIVGFLYVLCLTFIFPFMARCDNTVKELLRMCFVMSIRNIFPVLSAAVVNIGIFAFGIFVFWPILLVAPGLAAYINSYVFNHIFLKYNFNLPDSY